MKDIQSTHCKMIGYAGEYLVMSDLLFKGYHVSLVNDLSHYDILLNINSNIYRVEVKSTSSPCKEKDRPHPRYKFQFITRYELGHREDKYIYDFDLIAFAFLDIKKVAYILPDDVSKEGIMKSQIKWQLRKYSKPESKYIIEDHMSVPKNLIIPF